MTSRPRCGNDPRARLTERDRAAIDNFRAFLIARAEEKQTVTDLDAARAALQPYEIVSGFTGHLEAFEAAVRANERASSEARRLGAPDAVPAPSAAIRRKLRRWAYAAGHIELELADAVDRMYAAIAGDIARQQPATGRADLRQRIAAALYAHDHPGWLLPLHESDVEPVYQGRAAAVLPVLPAPADQVTGLLRRTETYLSALHGSVARHDNLAANLGCAGCELRDQIRAELRRAADETQPETDGASEPAELRSLPREVRQLVHAVDRMRADWAEAPEHGPERREMWTAVHTACDAVWNRDQAPAAVVQPESPVHAVPVPGSNGISSCCNRPPCEFVGERVTHDSDAVTCTGPAAAASEPEEDESGYAMPDPPIRCALPEQPGPAAEATP